MSWALRRQIIYVGVLIILFLGLGFLIVYPKINKMPTCSDGLQNGDETGVDCGGSCSKVCTFEVDKVSILWSRIFEVIPGRYNAVAYFENHNRTEAIYKIKYRFRFADENNIYIGKREGETYIPPSGKFAIFEPGISLGNSTPVYINFEFTEIPIWNKVQEDRINQLKILVSDIKLENKDTSPHLSAVIKNNSFFIIPEVSVIALLYDNTGNVVSVSRTYLEELNKEESKNIDFTWPEPILGNIVNKEIIPMFNIFLTRLK
jgi:hypothetical protein